MFKFGHGVGKQQSRDIFLFRLTCQKLQKFVVFYLDAVERNNVSVQRTKLYAQKYVRAWETVLMDNKC